MKKVLVGILFLNPFFQGCFKPNNTFEGMTPNNPVSEPSLSPRDSKAQAREFSSAVQESSTTSQNYQVSATLGDKSTTPFQKTQSGKYKVYLSVQGLKNSNPSVSLKK